MKTVKLAEINLGGMTATCIKQLDGSVNPYWLYANWYDGKSHRKLIAKYADMVSVLCHVTNFLRGEV